MESSIKIEWNKIKKEIYRIDSYIKSAKGPIPTKRMCAFLIAGEDHRYYSHTGVDIIALIRAILKTIVFDELQGGSTIAMQIVRTVTGHYEKTLKRKIIEIILAVKLTLHFGRSLLPIYYLCVAYYGWRMNNFKDACEMLNIKPNFMTEIEEARLVARLKYPEPQKITYERSFKIERRAKHLIFIRNRIKIKGDQYEAVQNFKPIEGYN